MNVRGKPAFPPRQLGIGCTSESCAVGDLGDDDWSLARILRSSCVLAKKEDPMARNDIPTLAAHSNVQPSERTESRSARAIPTELSSAVGLGDSATSGAHGELDLVGVAEGERVCARERSSLCGGSGAAPPLGEPPGSSSSLDTNDITRPERERCGLVAPLRAQFIEELGEATREHRRARRKVHGHKAAEAKNRAKQDGYSEGYAENAGRWHRSRAKGQETRPECALNCGEDLIRVTCVDCGRSHEKPGKCRLALWCVRCRGALASKKRAQFLASREVVLADAAARNLVGSTARKRWSEKLLTLTFPHLSEQNVCERIVIAFEAWRSFLKRLNKWAGERNARSLQWFRAFEWEPGSDGVGHPHFHIWIFSPFLDREQLLAWFRTAYELASGRAAPQHLIIDVRELKGGPRDAQEIIKYLTKDIDANGKLIPTQVFAQVYHVIDGKRLTQASAGFMGLGKVSGAQRCECGSSLKNVSRLKGETAHEC